MADPKAALHLRYAEEAFGQAKEIVKNGGDNRRADMLLRRAEADAEYALALAKEKATQEDAKSLLEQLQAVAVWQHEIEQENVGHAVVEQPPRTFEPLRARHGVAVELQHLFCGCDKVRFVVHQ